MDEIPGIRRVVRLPRVDSTQVLGRRMAEEGAPEWTLIWADRQTMGKGRLGRRWKSSLGGLYVSLILRPAVAPKRLAELSLAAADAVARAVNELSGLKTSVKPPNDVLALAAQSGEGQAPGRAVPPDASRSEFKKICGILIEASGGSERVDWVVLGLGLNVNNRTPKSLPEAASLVELAGREFDLEAVLRQLLESFRNKYRAFLTATNGHIEKSDKPA